MDERPTLYPRKPECTITSRQLDAELKETMKKRDQRRLLKIAAERRYIVRHYVCCGPLRRVSRTRYGCTKCGKVIV